jgi:uncharacterized protein (DUF4415 family)
MTVKKRALGSDLAKVDSHVIAKEEYSEIPELTDEDFRRAVPHIGGRRVGEAKFGKAWDKAARVGRPPSDSPKESVTLRLDPDVVEHFRKGGPGWQTRINDTLRRVAHLPRTKRA